MVAPAYARNVCSGSNRMYFSRPAVNDDTVTQLLRAAESGDREAFQQLYVRTYDELRRLAHRVRDNPGHQTLNTTALVHEAYIKLVPGAGVVANDRVHFFRIAARAMRQ